MSKNELRKDKTCLNCRYVVENRFCPNCGQENTDTRKTFHHLFIHFFEDLTHYENAFWKTIRNLLLKPASLTKEYLSGKRLSYLAPVRLYIFISFVTFLLISLFPDESQPEAVTLKENKKGEMIQYSVNGIVSQDYKHLSKEEIKILELHQKGALTERESDSLLVLVREGKIEKEKKSDKGFLTLWYDSIEQMDSIRKLNPEAISDFEYDLNKRSIEINEKYSDKEIEQKFQEAIWHNIPKVLFIYMPLFAFVLWLFHNKKRWYYFDHGIFTLHYFSFLLLILLLMFLFHELMDCFGDNSIITSITNIVSIAGYAWMCYYFFPAHHRFYGQSRLASFFKSITILSINSVLMGIMLIILIVYTFVNLH
ncbi:DUF3667 domain-containing protein [Flavobacterium sp.]|uniref:DUF3667 domain-containing protein n=1 Tax=Flavobacterium sp. TaxID=239 RepID=UPI002FDCF059